LLIQLTDGTQQITNVTLAANSSGWNVTTSGLDALGLSYNFTEFSFGMMIDDIAGEKTEAQFGEPTYWWWSLFVQNASTGAWQASIDGVADLGVVDIAWIATNGSFGPGQGSVAQHLPQWELQGQIADCLDADAHISIGGDGFTFSPATVTIQPGQSVCWSWIDSTMAHNVAQVSAADERTPSATGFRSGGPSRTVLFILDFEQPGSYFYICEVHVAMDGVIEVVDPNATVDDDPVVTPPPIVDERYTEDDDGWSIPGFTSMVGLTALIGAALLLSRRRND
jgi:PGF-CTERM protein